MQRLASAGCSPPAEPDTARRPPLPFPHRLAAPLFGALLSGVLTYCLHQCAATTPVQGRLIRARATYAAAAGVPAELPVSAEPVFLAGPAVGPQASRAESVDASSRLPVVRPIDLRFAREARPRRPLGARPKTGKLRPSGTASRHAVTRR